MTNRANKTKQEIAAGKRLRTARESKGLTQTQLANKLPGKTNQSIVHDLETAEYRLNGQMLIDLCKILDMSCDELLGIKAPNPLFKDPELVKRLSKIDKLKKKDREMLIGLIDTFLSKA